MDVERGEVVERVREQVERAGVTREAHAAGRERVPELVVPEILREAARQPEPAAILSAAVGFAERPQRPRERRDGRRVPLGVPRHEGVEEQVGRALGLRPGRRACGLGDLALVRTGSEAPGVHRRRDRLEVGLAGHLGVERIEPPGRLQQQRRRVAPAPAPEHDLRAQPLQPRALELVDRPERGAVQQVGRGRGVGDVELRLRRGERALRRAGRGPGSARRRAAGTRRPRRARHGPARAPRSAPSRRRPPRPGPPSRARDARRTGRGRRPGRSSRRAPGARRGGRSDATRGRPPSGRADAGSARVRPARSDGRPRRAARPRRRSRAGRRRATAGSGRPAARPPPSGAGAASRAEAPGRAGGRCARCGSPTAARRGARTRPPPRPASTRAAARSARAGCRRPRRGSGPSPARRAAPGSPRPAAAGPRRRPAPRSTSSGSPSRTCWPPDSRNPNTNPTRSASSRRATNDSVCADTRSSQCASSTMHTSGCSSAASASRLRTANPTRKRSGGGPAVRPNAVLSASRCGVGRCSRRSSIGAHSACRPAKGSSISDSTPAARAIAAALRGARQVPQEGGLADSRLAAEDQHPALARAHPGEESLQHVALVETVD